MKPSVSESEPKSIPRRRTPEECPECGSRMLAQSGRVQHVPRMRLVIICDSVRGVVMRASNIQAVPFSPT
jgi:DNA-directed RNA polymerase subunit RPC12/RpoP